MSATRRFAPFAAQRLENDRLAVLETRVDVRLRLGHHLALVSELETVIAADPLRERFHAQLMLALYCSGRQADALAAFQRARRLLSDLGIEPGPELRDLERAILVQAPQLDMALLQDSRAVGRATVDPPVALVPPVPPVNPQGRVPSVAPAVRSWLWGRRLAWRWSAVAAVVAVVAVGLAAVESPGGVSPVAHAAVAPVGVTELAAATGRLTRSLSLPDEPANAVSGDGSVWVTSPEAHALYRIDPVTGATVDSIPVGASAGALAIDGSDVWVTNTLDGTLTRVDTATDEAVQTVAVGSEPTGITVGDGSLWVADASASTLTEVDATTGHVRSTVPLSAAPFGVAFGAGSLWVSSPGGDIVTRLSPDGGPGVQIPVGAGPSSITFGLGSVWVANGFDSTVSRIDPATEAVIATIPVGDSPDGLAVVGDSVWDANRLSSTLTRIDAGTDTPVRSISVGASPVAVCAFDGRIFAATQATISGRPAGGTLRVVESWSPPSIDPALGYPAMPFQYFEGTYDTLVAFERVGGSAGLQLVPDLALTMPTITAGGTVYTFTLRPGLRYSDGLPVRPQDFRYAIERVMQLNATAASFLTGIVGAASCQGGEPCDLAQGITVSNSAGTVTFHLSAPDPDFLYKLALQFTAPTPPGVPDHDVGTDPVPSTGPYMIGRYLAGREVDFVPNPYFKEWSAAAEPAGSPDRIVWTFGASVPHEVNAIEAGQADWTDDSEPDVAGLVAEFPGQVHINPDFSIDYASFNTRVAPFDQQVVRQAFSLAANRTALVNHLGGTDVASPTCQILPPGIPGYQRYCPFTVDPAPGGAWVGPDLAAARELVAQSATYGMRVTVLSPSI